MIDVHKMMEGLSAERPIFHSEADFQHSLAWHLQQHFPEAHIRLEYPVAINNDNRMYLDLRVELAGHIYALELKYKTAKSEFTHNTETFYLKNQGAQDLGRYDFLRDIERLEYIVDRNQSATGIAMILTNDHTYWKSGRTGTIDEDFRIHESRIVQGMLQWKENASSGTTKGRAVPINLRHAYTLSWRDYSEMSETKYTKFKYAIARVT